MPASVQRIEVFPAPGRPDPIGESVRRDAAAIGIPLDRARAAHVYLIQAPLSAAQVETVRTRLLTDPVTESSTIGASPVAPASQLVEVHPLPGVMDPVAQSVQSAIAELLELPAPPQVSTGWRYDLFGCGREQADTIAQRLLANPVIQRIHAEPFLPASFPVGASHDHEVRTISLLRLGDDELTRLSRDAHLFLSLDEMRAIQRHFKSLRRDPTDIELETLAQTWSEHCVHKTLKSTVTYRGAATPTPDPIKWANRPGHVLNKDGSVTINNLLKSTVAAATHKLIAEGIDWTLSVFVDNAGVIAFDEKHAVCVKVETHNHPSAIEPYGGAATGVGGCIRDVIGTGLGARPIANTDVFCVAFPEQDTPIPSGCLHPRRILTQVVAGVRDYGNRMGIPTVNGAVSFDNRYIGNPLVFCGCVGVMPRDRVKGHVRRGDLIVALGGRTGRDGIHGATFSSAELEHSAADEFSHAVQIGNAITEKQVLDAIIRARDESPEPLYHGLTDCGAGGFSSAIGELGKETGATVHLDRAPLKYQGLSYTEIWISEAQERMVLAVPPANLDALKRICAEESVELAVLGEFSPPEQSAPDNPDLRLLFHGKEVGRLSMHFLHDGIPTPTREAKWNPRHSSLPSPSLTSHPKSDPGGRHPTSKASITSSLLRLLSHPDIASKHWIIRQYDHEVRGATAMKPLCGPAGRGPSDASVVMPVAGSHRGLAIACGLQTPIGDPLLAGDPYLMVLAAIDECVRNLVCGGADPSRIAILDNFCWPSCGKPENLGSLVRAAEGCYDAAMAYRTPFVSGKDSLNNQFTTQDGKTIEIPPTLLISGIGIVNDVRRCVTMDIKEPGNLLVIVGATGPEMGGSKYQQVCGINADVPFDTFSQRGLAPSVQMPRTDMDGGPRTARAVADLISLGLVRSAHDCSEGGMLVAIAEMLIGAANGKVRLGAEVNLGEAPAVLKMTLARTVSAFSETPSRYILEVRQPDFPRIRQALGDIPHDVVGVTTDRGVLDLTERLADPIPVEKLVEAWTKPLDW